MNRLVKFFVINLIIFFSWGLIIKSVYSQTPTIIPGSSSTSNQLDTLLENSSCGELNQSCCDVSNLNIPNTTVNLSSPFSVLNEPVNLAIEFISNLTKPILNTIKNFLYVKLEINQQAFCKDGTQPSDLNNPTNCTCISEALANASRLCLGITRPIEKSECLSCVTSQKGIWTAIGCVQSDLGTFISQKLLGWGVGLAGIIAMLCIIYSAFQLQTSRGNPEKIKKAQELLTSCIMGLMLIIFSVFILRLIGVDILRIPGFQ